MMKPPDVNETDVRRGDRLVIDPRFWDIDHRDTMAELYYAIADSPPVDGAPLDNGLELKYDHRAGLLFVRDSDSGGWVPAGGVAPGTSFVIETARATVYGPGSRIITVDAKELKAQWMIEFKHAFTGQHQVYMRVVDELGTGLGGDTGWQWKGWLEIR
jgi:hypothetical protein